MDIVLHKILTSSFVMYIVIVAGICVTLLPNVGWYGLLSLMPAVFLLSACTDALQEKEAKLVKAKKEINEMEYIQPKWKI